MRESRLVRRARVDGVGSATIPAALGRAALLGAVVLGGAGVPVAGAQEPSAGVSTAPVRPDTLRPDCAGPDADSARAGRRAARLRVLPVFGGAPETGLQGGLTALRLGRPGAARRDTTLRPSIDQLFVVVTQRGQLRAFVERDAWRDGNRRRLNARLEAQRFPQPYFGLGPDAPLAAEEWYTATSARGFVTVQQAVPARLAAALTGALAGTPFVGLGRLAQSAYLQGTYRLTLTDIVSREPGGALAGPGAPPGAAGGRVGQLELGAVLDTRSNLFAPERGTFVQVAAARAGRLAGSEFTFTRVTTDARVYRALGARTVVAAQLVADVASGAAPFDQLPLVGGPTVLRGYVLGRWRDRALAAAQLEVRQQLPWRTGVVAFGGVGGVGPTLARAVTDAPPLPSWGVGLRWALLPRERANLRLDLARGRDGARGVYVGFAEAF